MMDRMALPRPLTMAHRGDSVHAPGNSPAASNLALQAGADILETDLWLTRDEVLVCHHDRTLDRVTDCRIASAQDLGCYARVPLRCTSYVGESDAFVGGVSVPFFAGAKAHGRYAGHAHRVDAIG